MTKSLPECKAEEAVRDRLQEELSEWYGASADGDSVLNLLKGEIMQETTLVLSRKPSIVL